MNKLFEDVSWSAKEIIKKGKKANPMLFMVKNDTLAICPLAVSSPMRNPINLVKSIVDHEQPEFYITVAEAWGIQSTVMGLKEMNLKYGDIAKMSEKMEMLLIIGRSKDGAIKRDDIWYIKRDGDKIGFVKEEGSTLESKRLP